MRDEDFENIDPGPGARLVQDGQYPADCLGYKPRDYGDRWGERLVVTWKVYLSPEDPVELPRYYTIRRSAGGRFSAGDRHAYRRDWIRANNGRLPEMRQRLPFSIFLKGRFLVAVETVTQDSNKQPLHPSSYYSKISRVIRPIQDGDSLKTFQM